MTLPRQVSVNIKIYRTPIKNINTLTLPNHAQHINFIFELTTSNFLILTWFLNTEKNID
uniref:Uncharacterized protein n=1 Tax=Lepeophtheirus salmonis TaxID=72036 RepID=A0A0K2TRY7_LEPSM